MGIATQNSSERTCVVCRAEKGPDDMLPLVWGGSAPAVALRAADRRAWVCVEPACLRALDAKTLGRALKAAVGGFDTPAFLATVHQLASVRVHEHIGLSRRDGSLEVGSDRVLSSEDGGTVIVAEDLAERTREHGKRAGAWLFSTSEALGRACGMGRVGVLALRNGRLAAQAAYWLGVWRATTNANEVT
jgi:predicted RNA-binding protein YlxR (DUF448 family)